MILFELNLMQILRSKDVLFGFKLAKGLISCQNPSLLNNQPWFLSDSRLCFFSFSILSWFKSCIHNEDEPSIYSGFGVVVGHTISLVVLVFHFQGVQKYSYNLVVILSRETGTKRKSHRQLVILWIFAWNNQVKWPPHGSYALSLVDDVLYFILLSTTSSPLETEIFIHVHFYLCLHILAVKSLVLYSHLLHQLYNDLW